MVQSIWWLIHIRGQPFKDYVVLVFFLNEVYLRVIPTTFWVLNNISKVLDIFRVVSLV